MNPAERAQSWNMPQDMAELAEAGEVEMIREILQIFLEDTPRNLNRLIAAIDAHDTAAVERLGHGLKGGCAQIGAARLAQIAAEWEHGANDPLRWRTLLGSFQSEFVKVEASMRAHRVFSSD